MTTEELDNRRIYLKIPITTRYSADLSYFDKDKTTVVEGKEFCEKDIFGNEVCCWYVSTTFGACDDKDWLIDELIECGYIPSIIDFKKGLFKSK